MAKTSAGKRSATKAPPARRKRRWQIEKTGGIAPASSARAKPFGGAPVSAEAKDQADGGAFLWIEHFHGSGDAPSTTTVTSGSGKRLRNAVVNLIFWGDAWQASPGPSPSLAQVVSDAASILAGPYQVRVAQYGATAARLGTVFVSVPGFNPPKPSFTTPDVAKLITDAIEGGALPEPDEETTDVLHVVFMPPGTAPPPNLGGLHTYASYTDFDFFPFDFDINQRSHFAWVFFSNRANVSSVFSHELVEALTDPEGDGVQVNPTNPTNWNEIGDVCSSRGTVNGVTVQSYWSQQDLACVIPVNLVFEFEITSIRRSRAGALMYPIDEVAGINHTAKQPFRMTQAEVIAAIDRGDRVFIKGKGGREVNVGVQIHFPPWSLQGVRYITTSPKNGRADQLFGLPKE